MSNSPHLKSADSVSLSAPAGHWIRMRSLSLRLLAAWFMVTFLGLFFARDLAALHFFSWPVSLYLAAQGLTLIYLMIIAMYCVYARRIEKTSQHEAQQPQSLQNTQQKPSDM